MNQSYTAKEREHLKKVKELPCSVCDAIGPSDAHHIKQNNAFSCIALCKDCHQGAHNGIHGNRFMWKLKKMDEVDALIITFKRLGYGVNI